MHVWRACYWVADTAGHHEGGPVERLEVVLWQSPGYLTSTCDNRCYFYFILTLVLI